MSIIVYGASDDLIEVEGAIREEFSGGDEPRYLGFSNGVVLKVTYDDEGIWRLTPRSGTSLVTITFAKGGDDGTSDEDGCPCYSDKAVLSSDASWVICGDEWAS